MKIGIDLGVSSTKIVTLVDEKPRDMELWDDPFSEDKLKDFISRVCKSDEMIEQINVTGIGSSKLGPNVGGKYVVHVDEFFANTLAVRQFCKEKRAIVASLGTGTSVLEVSHNGYTHLGGSAMGGGSLLALFRLLVPGGGWTELRELAAKGELNNVDLQIRDVSDKPLPQLPLDTTIANLIKANAETSPEDIALGLVNMTLQNLGAMAYLAGSGRDIFTYVMIGRMTSLPFAREIFARLEKLYRIHIVVPKDSSFMTAIGAALK